MTKMVPYSLMVVIGYLCTRCGKQNKLAARTCVRCGLEH